MLVCTLYSMLSRCCSFLYIWQHYIASLQQQWTEIRPVKSLMLVVTRAKPPPKKTAFFSALLCFIVGFYFPKIFPPIRSCLWMIFRSTVRSKLRLCVCVCGNSIWWNLVLSCELIKYRRGLENEKSLIALPRSPHTLSLSLFSFFRSPNQGKTFW